MSSNFVYLDENNFLKQFSLADDTLIGKTTTDILKNKTLSTDCIWNGTAINSTYIETGIVNNKIVEIDSTNTITSGQYAMFTNNGIKGTALSIDNNNWNGNGTDLAASNIDTGITDDKIVKIDSTNTITAGQYAKFTTTGIKGHTLGAGDVGLGSVENTALSTWSGTSNITTIGTLTGTLSAKKFNSTLTGPDQNAGYINQGGYHFSSGWSIESWYTTWIVFLKSQTCYGFIRTDLAQNKHFAYISFTGQHRNVPNNIDIYNNIDNYKGYIVCSSGDYKTYDIANDILLTNKNAITMNNSLPIIKLSEKKKDKSVFGVLSDKEEEDRFYSAGAFCTPISNKNDEKRVYINSLGEGAIWIVNTNGNLENGDYIQSSDVIGHGEKQEDDILHNYTVAKITCDCDFNLNTDKYECSEFVDTISGNTYRKALVGCTYHCG